MTKNAETNLKNLLKKIANQTNMEISWYTDHPKNLFENVIIKSGLFKDIESEWNDVLKRINKKNPRLFLHGDYDVDGVTSSEIIVRSLKKKYLWDKNIFVFFPKRQDGYGITTTSVKRIKKYKPDIIFAVDCGTNDLLLRQYAVENPKIEVFVLDHHIISSGNEITPSNFHLINTHLYQLSLSSGGLAFCFALVLLNQSLYNSDEIGLAGLSTVADQMDLSRPENYALTKLSLQFLNSQIPDWAYRLGQTQKFTSNTLGFQLAPRINAISRVGKSPSIAAKALRGDIDSINELNKANVQRQNDIDALFFKYMPLVFLQSNTQVVFLVIDEDVLPGYLGLLASKIVDVINKPVLVCTKEKNNIFIGSARGIKGIHVINDILNPAKDFFAKFGGHESAAGFSFANSERKNLEQFFKNIKINIGQQEYDSIILDDLSFNFLRSAAHATFLSEPHGNGNPEPVFQVKNCKIIDILPLKDGQYTSVIIEKNEKTLKLPFWEKYRVVYDSLNNLFNFNSGKSEDLNIFLKARYTEQSNFTYSYELINVSSKDQKQVFSKKYVKTLLIKQNFM